MTKLSLPLAISSLALAVTVTGCSGSSGARTPSGAATPTPSATSARPHDAVGAESKFNVPMSQKNANRAIPKLKALPGVVRVHYNTGAQTLFVTMSAAITLKQRNHVVQVMGRAANR